MRAARPPAGAPTPGRRSPLIEGVFVPVGVGLGLGDGDAAEALVDLVAFAEIAGKVVEEPGVVAKVCTAGAETNPRTPSSPPFPVERSYPVVVGEGLFGGGLEAKSLHFIAAIAA